MTIIDYAVITVVALSVLLGLWRGVVGEVLALCAWVAAYFAARYAAPFVAPVLAGIIPEAGMRLAAAWIGIFVTVLLVLAVIRLLVKRLLQAVGLGWIDRLLGALFGVMRGVLVVLFGVLVAGLTPLPKRGEWQSSALAPPLETVVIAAKPSMPVELAKRISYR